ncbi:MMS19 nucleotide excision repair protein homolog isoform X2 [Rhodamnia argentea]|uniref:MMS19 nucleotide excision repair protein n=1 Tax=Rhodamnia argentea TaxID=178133 RepID=A0ABM3H017_9MYRT|nr:MMS19 nucleotide excision repair protein homolog isoform X2 [Rhodamnia argentea]
MAELSELTRHIESYVDTSRSPSEQVASLRAITSLLKKNLLPIEILVREMGLYLTSTDSVIRCRGILLLAESLDCLSSKPLDTSTIHSLIIFFADRLADWKALRGALVGCLALMRRKDGVGIVTISDALAVTKSYVHNLHVQSLAQHDRMLCFELLECLLENYPDAIVSVGNEIFYAICEAVDYEKDPQCLLVAFHIVELAMRLFPDLYGPSDGIVGEIFDTLGRYFPIHFTHPKGEDVDVTRDELSRALMFAFTSTPLFEPFAIPLLLEKLSSSLPLAKIDALKYLSHCTLKYGADRMEKHAVAIWSSLRNIVFSSSQEPVLSFDCESVDGIGFSDDDIAKEALTVLEKLFMQNSVLFLNLIVNDEDINLIFDNINSYMNFSNISLQSKRKIHGVGCILATAARSTVFSCNRIFESFFPCLMNTLGISILKPSDNMSPSGKHAVSGTLNFGALYLSVIVLEACRDLTVGSAQVASFPTHETFCCMLERFSASLARDFISYVGRGNETSMADVFLGVKGLQILATFPGSFLSMPESLLEYILTALVSIITENFQGTLSWNLALKALVNVGSYIEKYHESKKEISYMVVVEKIGSLLTAAKCMMPYSRKLEAVSEVGMSGRNYMLKVVPRLEEAIFTNLSDLYVNGYMGPAENTVRLLECYTNKVLPWINNSEGFDEVLHLFVINIWNQIECCKHFSTRTEEKDIFEATMKTMKFAVSNCSETSHNAIVQKAYAVVSSCHFFSWNESAVNHVEMRGLDISHELKLSIRDRWVLSLFASVIMAIHPQTRLPDVRATLWLFMEMLLKGHVPSAQALGSLVNKFGSKANGQSTLDEAMDIIFNTSISHADSAYGISMGIGDKSTMNLADLCFGASNSRLLQINAIVGLAWIGKGLLMRGHEKVKDIVMILLECLSSKGGRHLRQDSGQENCEQDVSSSVMTYVADAFHIMMSDSEVCLSRRYHANIRPLYKQRFFSTMMPMLQALIIKSDSLFQRSVLCRALAYIMSETPLVAVLGEAKKLTPVLLDALLMFSKDNLDKDTMYSLLLLLSGILTDKSSFYNEGKWVDSLAAMKWDR